MNNSERVEGTVSARPLGEATALSLQDRMQILYEIAISIGITLDLRVMLTTALDVFLRQLNCTSGAIYVARPSNPPQEPTTAIPRNLRHNEAVRWVQSTIQAAPEWHEWPALLPSLPQSARAGDDLFVHGLALGNLGFMVLARPAQPLDDEMLNMLSPLLIKLTESSRACLQNEELATAHQSILWERNMLRSLIEATPTILYSLDKEGRVLYCEGRGLQLLGLDAEQVRGASVFEVYAETPGAIEALQAAMEGRQASATYELEGRSLDVVLQPVVDARGDLHGVVGVSYDVTERKTAIDTLTAVLNSVGEGVVTVREPAQIVMVNRRTTEMFGYEAEELIGQPLWRLFPDDVQPQPATTVDDFIGQRDETRTGAGVELEGRHKDGESFPIELRSGSFVLAGNKYHTLSLRDITDLKEYERLRDDFTSTVSHELRTPLASIMGWTETLLTEHPGPLNDLQKRFLNTVYASSVRLDKLIEEILTVSRIQRGTLRLQPAPCDPAKLLQSVLAAVAPLVSARSITLTVEDLWPVGQMVMGDAERLEQTMLQLLTNAVKFSHSGGEVVVRSSLDGATWRFEVQDQGMGVAEDEIPLIFHRFYRGRAARKAQIQGAGLGLYVCKAVVEGHGGEIYVNSRPDAGTLVRFDMPLRETPA